MIDWIGYWLPVIVVAVFVLASIAAVTRLRRKRPNPWLPETEDERIGSLTRRYVHGDLTLDEFEEQVDAVLRGEPLFTLDPWWVNQEPVGLWITEETIVKYPQAGGTVIL